MAFNPDGSILASAGFDNTIALWDVESGELLTRLIGHTDFVFDVDWSSDGSRLLSASRDSTLILWDVGDGTALHAYSDESGRSFTASFIDDRHAVSGGSSSDIRFWSLYDEREQQRIEFVDDSIYSMAIGNHGQIGAVGLHNDVVLFDLQENTEIHRFQYEGGAVTSLTFTPDEKTLIAGYEDSTTIVWDVENGVEIRRLKGHTAIVVNVTIRFGRILDLNVSPDGRSVLSGAEDRTMLVWDVASGEIIHKFESCSDTINTGVFSPNGQYIAAGFGALSDPTRGDCPQTDHSIHLWDAETGELIRQFEGHEGAVVKVAFSPDGQHLISGSIDETIRLWDVETGAEIGNFGGQTGGVNSINFSADGQFIVSGSRDGTIRVWDMATGDLMRQIVGHTGNVNHVQFVQNDRLMWSSSEDGTLRLWQPVLDLADLRDWVASNRYIRDFTCSEYQLYQIDMTCSSNP